MMLLAFIFGMVGILAVCDFFVLLIDERRMMGNVTLKLAEGTAVFLGPFLFLSMMDSGKENNCCDDNVFFSPPHRFSIHVLIVLCAAAYFYSSYRKRSSPPFLELVINAFLLVGIVLNVFVAIQTDLPMYWMLGNVPIIAFFFSMLLQNQRMLVAEMTGWENEKMNFVERLSLMILRSNFFIKYPVLLILCLPLLVLLAALLFLFGQKPDAMIRAFTDTYKHGLSQLDYMCDNVKCGGHYLCSVAAKGHKNIVKPIRTGERHGNKIICNRQLLISNAFEELIEQKFPKAHHIIRRNYDKVGDMIRNNDDIFNNKYFSDFIYIVMKPLEWTFLFVLYVMDKKPENRIAQQYLKKADRTEMKKNFF